MVNNSSDNGAPADATSDNWVDLYAPAFVVPYLRLMRADRPIGTWLLLLPCFFGMGLGLTDQSEAVLTLNSLVAVLLFSLGALIMRGAGCTYNDIAD